MIKNENGYFATLGIYTITPTYQDEQDVRHYLEEEFYNVVLNMLTSHILWLEKFKTPS